MFILEIFVVSINIYVLHKISMLVFLFKEKFVFNKSQSKNKSSNLKDVLDTADFLDYIILSLETGSSIFSAFEQATTAMASGNIYFAANTILLDITLGRSFLESLQKYLLMQKRGCFFEVVDLLFIAMQNGTNLEEYLRKASAELRFSASAIIEEKAAKVPILMLFPLVFCVLPSLFILLGGAAIRDFFLSLGIL